MKPLTVTLIVAGGLAALWMFNKSRLDAQKQADFAKAQQYIREQREKQKLAEAQAKSQQKKSGGGFLGGILKTVTGGLLGDVSPTTIRAVRSPALRAAYLRPTLSLKEGAISPRSK